MGADIVIAVDLETAPLDTKAPQSLFSLSGRAISVMIAANEKYNMKVADILITVNLAGYTGEDYKKGDKIADIGYEGAEKKSALLSRLAVDDSTWQHWYSGLLAGSRRFQRRNLCKFREATRTMRAM